MSRVIHIREYLKITLGPVLVMMALIVFLYQHSLPLAFLGALAAISIPFVWRFQLRAAVYTSITLFLAFLGIYSLHESSYLILWIFFWCLALASGLVVTALCSREYHVDKLALQERDQERVIQLEQGYQTTQKQLEGEIGSYIEQVTLLKETAMSRDQEISAFKQLVIASKEEADKYFMQCEHLNNEVMKLHRKSSVIEELEYVSRQIESKNKQLLKLLNEARVERYQYQILAQAPASQSTSKKQEMTDAKELHLRQELAELERERTSVKKLYEEHLRDYQALSDKLQTFFTLDELAYYTHRELSFENSYADLKEAFQEKGKILQEVRVEIFKIEGAILQMKKELTIPVEESLSPGSYLAVADQECLRLEEENTILLQFVSQVLPLLEKRLEKEELKQPLESQHHFE